MASLRQNINRISNIILNTIFPPRCLICDKNTDVANLMCSSCWSNITFISDPKCLKCGSPFPYNTLNDNICHYCLEDKPKFDTAVSAIRFDEHSEPLIHNFKYYGKNQGCNQLATLMLNSYGDKINAIDIICPIPMHKDKIQKRKYNQAALLAKAIKTISNKDYYADLLIKTRQSQSQSGLSKEDRKTNVKNTFKINSALKKCIINKNILIIDDVLTTGSTASECSKILKRNGARKISILTIARTY